MLYLNMVRGIKVAGWVGWMLLVFSAACRNHPGGKEHSRGRAVFKSVSGEANGATGDVSESEEAERLYLIYGGDFILQEQLKEVARACGGVSSEAECWRRFFDGIEPIFEEYEKKGRTFVGLNLESPIATEINAVRSFPPVFNGPPEALEGLKLAGVDFVTISNNHALDQGRGGLVQTIDNLEAVGMKYVGFCRSESCLAPLVVGEGGEAVVKVALFSFLVKNGVGERGSGAGGADRARISIFSEAVPEKISEIVRSGNFNAVVVFLHWIGEFVERPLQSWKNIVGKLALSGVDLIVGTGPHVVGPVELVKGKGRGKSTVVIYSVGNLLANFGWKVYPVKDFRAVYYNDKGRTSEKRIKTRFEALVVAEFNSSGLGRLFLYPLWLDDNRFAAFRKVGPKRMIKPTPVPACMPEFTYGCPRGAYNDECKTRWMMIFEAGRYMVERLWGGKWMKPLKCKKYPPAFYKYELQLNGG